MNGQKKVMKADKRIVGANIFHNLVGSVEPTRL
jgi:hypothetical protein